MMTIILKMDLNNPDCSEVIGTFPTYEAAEAQMRKL